MTDTKLELVEQMRRYFETITLPNFDLSVRESTQWNERLLSYQGSPLVIDHWQTFQEGWACALDALQKNKNKDFSDVISNGGYDER